jgi:hypothetical protein
MRWPVSPRKRERKATTSGYEFFVNLNIKSWLIWALFPLLLITGSYKHAVGTIQVEDLSNAAAIKQIHHDPRIAALTAFMDKHKFAKPYYVKEYIQSADRSHIDYRLLTAIALAESSGCKRYLYDNCWGYGSSSGLVHFASIPEGIAFISDKLSAGPYAGKSNLEKARIYGPHSNPNYGPSIIKSINEIK